MSILVNLPPRAATAGLKTKKRVSMPSGPKRPQNRPVGLLGLLAVLLVLAWAPVRAADVTVRWVIQPDDSGDVLSGPASGYTLYYGQDSAAVVDAAEADQVDTTGTAWYLVDLPGVPGQVGDTVTMPISGIEIQVDYWYTMKAVDDAGNRSNLGNIVKHRVADVVKPGPVIIDIF